MGQAVKAVKAAARVDKAAPEARAAGNLAVRVALAAKEVRNGLNWRSNS